MVESPHLEVVVLHLPKKEITGKKHVYASIVVDLESKIISSKFFWMIQFLYLTNQKVTNHWNGLLD